MRSATLRLLRIGSLRVGAAVASVVAELRLVAGAGDEDGNLGSSTVFLEEAVGGFQQHAFPSADHFGDGSLHLRGTSEVKGFAVGAIGSMQVDVGAGDVV